MSRLVAYFLRRSFRRKRGKETAPRCRESEMREALDTLIDRKRELFKIEDERLRNRDTQGSAITAVAVATIAAFNVVEAGMASRILVSLVGIAAALAALNGRREEPKQLRPNSATKPPDEPEDAARERDIDPVTIPEFIPTPNKLVNELREYVGLGNRRVEQMTWRIREELASAYSDTSGAYDDELARRLRILDDWDLRYKSASERMRIKARWISGSLWLLAVEIVVALVALLL